MSCATWAQAIRTRAADYLAGTDPADPLVSPIFADFAGLPPLLIQAGSHEVLLDDATRLAVARCRPHERFASVPGTITPSIRRLGTSTVAEPVASAIELRSSSAVHRIRPAFYLTATRLTGWMSGARASRLADTWASAAGIWPLMCAVRASSVAKVSKMP